MENIQKSNSMITIEMVGLLFKIYQGNRFIPVQVKSEMVGKKFGEFIKTRKLHVFKKK